jgi:micrococcal nuclease
MRHLRQLGAHAPIAAVLAVSVLVAGCDRDRAALDRLAATGSGKVVSLISADTVRLADGRSVHLAGITAPRQGDPYGAQARAALDALTTGQEVDLLSGGARQDAYGRTLAHLRTKKGRVWIQGALLDSGAVRVRTYADNRALAAQMLEREARARRAGKGLWADKANQVLLPQEAARAVAELDVVAEATAAQASRCRSRAGPETTSPPPASRRRR